MAKKKKSEEATVRARVEEVLRIRLDGAQAHDVLQYASEKRWGLTERQVRTYMRRADDLLIERQERKRRRIIAVHLARREMLYGRTVNAADYGTALRVLADLAKLQDLYTDDRDVREIIKLHKELLERMKSIEEKRRHEPEPNPLSAPPTGPAGHPVPTG